VYARVQADGRLAEENGKVEIRYKPSDGRRYDAMAKNLSELSTELLPDDTCAPAAKPEPKVAAARNAGANGGGAAAAPAGAKGAPRAGPGRAMRERREDAPRLVEPGPGRVVAYTDGACTGNPGPAGLGAVVVHGGERVEISEYLGSSTNNIAELTAVLRAVELAPRDQPIVVHTDSQYAIGVLARGWKAKANTELVAAIRAAIAKHGQVELLYVPGHSGYELNERADQLARAAIARRGDERRTITIDTL
jgi:ribonuclease HI